MKAEQAIWCVADVIILHTGWSTFVSTFGAENMESTCHSVKCKLI